MNFEELVAKLVRDDVVQPGEIVDLTTEDGALVDQVVA